jgi:hypothetical protein
LCGEVGDRDGEVVVRDSKVGELVRESKLGERSSPYESNDTVADCRIVETFKAEGAEFRLQPRYSLSSGACCTWTPPTLL